MKQPNWNKIRLQFPVTKRFIYFNHAAVSPLSLQVQRAIAECLKKYCEYGIVCVREYLGTIEHARMLAAQLIGAKPSEIAFVKNTTQGILLAANGIKWRKGDNVLIPEKEFPANVFPWLGLTTRGVRVKFIRTKNGRFSVSDIKNCIDKRTRAISVSAVSFTDGFACDLASIGELCKAHGIIFIVDAIQGLGAIEMNVKKCHIDILSSSAHKWLLGPQGIGIFYVSETMLENLDVSNLGWMSMENEYDYLNYNVRLKNNAARFEEGTRNIPGIVGLKTSLEMILGIGIKTIQQRLLELTDVLIQNLLEHGYVVTSSVKAGERSGILSFRHEEISTKDIIHKLYKADVVCAHRDGAVRIAPHFYNNTTDIEGFISALP